MTLHFERERDDVSLIAEAINRALSPFKTGKINVTMVDGAIGQKDLFIELETLPEQCCIIPIDTDYFVAYPEKLPIRIAEIAFKHYRNLPRVESEPNIILGEE